MPERSSTGRRVSAALIDLVPVLLVAYGLSDRQSADGRVGLELTGWRFGLATFLGFGYYFVSEWLTSTTPGKRLLGLTVASVEGTRLSARSTATRTLLHAIDGLPVLYLVGFIAILASPSQQRLGDMAASTRVVKNERSASGERQTLTPRDGVLGAVLVSMVLIGTVTMSGPGDRNVGDDQVGAFDYQTDVVPMVDRLMVEGLGEWSAAPFVDLLAGGADEQQETIAALAQLAEAAGEWSGSYSVEQHVRAPDAVYPKIRAAPLEVTEVYIDTAYAAGPARVRLAVADVDGTLRLIAWDVRATES